MLPVELAEPGQLLGKMLAGQERRQHPDRQRRGQVALPAGQAERAERADRDQPRGEVAAPLRGQRGGQPGPAAGRPGRSGARPGCAPALGRQPSLTTPRSRRRPGLTTVTVTVPDWPRWILASPDRLTSSWPTLAARIRSPARASEDDGVHGQQGGPGPEDGHDQAAGQRQQRRPAGQRHRGTGTAASRPCRTPSGVAPSSSTSGRSWIRCRSVGPASAFTSSGVT